MCVKEVTWFGDHLLFPLRGTGTQAQVLIRRLLHLSTREKEMISCSHYTVAKFPKLVCVLFVYLILAFWFREIVLTYAFLKIITVIK